MDKHLLNADNIINQDILRQLEALCTQEEPPACTAACPLHLDARKFCRLVAAEDFTAAFKLYQKAVPFARLIAHTCDAPCQTRCRRAERGGSIELRRLEQAVSDAVGTPAKPPLMMSKKKKRAAIVGGGLRGMAAAYDLARKGYQVTIFEKTDRLGGVLCTLSETRLPSKLLVEEVASLLTLGVRVEFGVAVPTGNAAQASAFLLNGFDAGFIACSSPLDGMADKQSLLVKGQGGLLAGRRAGRFTDGHSTVCDVFDGRSAASSMDRLFQQVSMMAGREKEGSAETLLYTNLDSITDVPPVSFGTRGYTHAQAVQEAERCIQCECMECVKKCGFLQHYKGNPRKYVREVYNNLSIAMGTHHANGMINTCALCGQCEAICPNGLDLAQMFRAARERMVNTGKMPMSAHEFAMENMDYSLSDSCYLARHQPEHSASKWVFFPGCQLAASEPSLVQEVYSDLCGRMDGGVGLWLACCGVIAYWAGDQARFEVAKDKLYADWNILGRPKVLAACPTCATTLRELCGIDAVTLFEVLDERGAPENVGAYQNLPASFVLHHACGARHNDEVQRSVVRLAIGSGATLLDSRSPQAESPCCGYGGLVPFVSGEVAAKITNVTLAQLAPDDETAMLTYCVNCRDRYLAKGRKAWHLLELLYPNTLNLRHSNPTWSQRQYNQAGLRVSLLHDFWNETVEEASYMVLYIDDTLEQKLEDIHILHSDIEAAIQLAEAQNQKLLDPATGQFVASHRPRNVTFWVRYSPDGDGYRIHNVWCHRMNAVLTDRLTESGAAQ